MAGEHVRSDIHAFATDPADADHAWAFVTGFGLFETTDADDETRFYRSQDGGNSWPGPDGSVSE